MRTRDMSKAQLLRYVKDLTGLYNLEKLSAEKLRAKLQSESALLDEKETLLNTARADRDALYTGCMELRNEVQDLNSNVNDLKNQRDNWRAEYYIMKRKMEQMQKNFFTQAALAGELADNSYTTEAPVTNMESNR